MRDGNEDINQPDCYHIPDGGVLYGTPGILSTSNNYSHVAAYQAVNNTGIYAVTTVSSPYFDTSNPYDELYDHTDNQVWIQTGDCEQWLEPWGCSAPGTGGNNEAVQSIEVGWQINHYVTGDWNTRLFFFTTYDGYQLGTYVYNDGTATGNDVAPFTPYSGGGPALNTTLASSNTYPMPEMTIQVNSWYGVWWIGVNGYWIGYIKTNWFTSGTLMENGGATRLQVGGEVYSANPTVPYTLTAMGSGVEPYSSAYTNSAYFRDVEYIDGNTETWYNANMSYVNGLPSYELDESIPGVCGYLAGYWFNKCDSAEGCAPLSGADWAEYGWWFYFGGRP